VIRSARLFLPLALGLAACAERWERPGATEAEAEAAQAACTALAAREVPPALVWTQIAPPRFDPPERRCRTFRGVTECWTLPGRYHPPLYGWVDAAEEERRQARAACLREGGWTYRGLELRLR
jgi:hypothetical protein